MNPTQTLAYIRLCTYFFPRFYIFFRTGHYFTFHSTPLQALSKIPEVHLSHSFLKTFLMLHQDVGAYNLLNTQFGHYFYGLAFFFLVGGSLLKDIILNFLSMSFTSEPKVSKKASGLRNAKRKTGNKIICY